MIKKYCFVDVETTGRRPVERYGIIQLSGIVCHEEDRQLTEVTSFDFRMNTFPADVIEPEALSVNGNTVEGIRSYPDPKRIHAKLLDVFGNQVDRYNKLSKMFFVGYNANFDMDHVRSWFEKCGDTHFGSWFWSPAIDIMSLAGERLSDTRHEMPNFKLSTVAGALGVPLENAHDAMSDIRASLGIYGVCTNKVVL